MFRRVLICCAVVLSAVVVRAGDSCCNHCGCARVKKICVPVKEVKKETTYEYSCVCEDFCVPGPSKCVGTRCEPGCNGCSKCVKVMQPTCAEVRTRTKLIKTPVVKEVCTVKWVVKTVCCDCNHDCNRGTCTEGVDTALLTPHDGLVPQAAAETALQPIPPSPNDVLPEAGLIR